MHPQAKLFEIVRATRLSSRFAGSLDRGQEQGHEHADDRDDDEQFDERKGLKTATFKVNRAGHNRTFGVTNVHTGSGC